MSCGSPLCLSGKKGLIVGIANEKSIAWGCAQACHALGAEIAVTYQTEKAKTYVQPLAEKIGAPLLLPCDVQDDASLKAVFDAVTQKWGHLDFLIHSIAFAPMADLHGRVVDCSREGFTMAMDISCHSFIRMAKLAEPLMSEGGSMLTMTYYGSEKVVTDYNMMGPVKAALESTTRYLATEMGQKGIRVLAVSPGPVDTRAASGIKDFKNLLEGGKAKAPLGRLADASEVGKVASFLVSDLASGMTGNTIYVDGGCHILGG